MMSTYILDDARRTIDGSECSRGPRHTRVGAAYSPAHRLCRDVWELLPGQPRVLPWRRRGTARGTIQAGQSSRQVTGSVSRQAVELARPVVQYQYHLGLRGGAPSAPLGMEH